MSSVLLPVHNKQGLVSHLSTQDNNRSSVRPIHTGQFPYYVKLSVPSVHNRQCQVFHNRQCQVFHLSKLDMVWCPTCVQRTMPNVHTRQCQVSQLSKTENVKCSTCPHWTGMVSNLSAQDKIKVSHLSTTDNVKFPHWTKYGVSPAWTGQCQMSTRQPCARSQNLLCTDWCHTVTFYASSLSSSLSWIFSPEGDFSLTMISTN